MHTGSGMDLLLVLIVLVVATLAALLVITAILRGAF